eukprot:793802-Prorocentrum_minimum.AAC.6
MASHTICKLRSRKESLSVNRISSPIAKHCSYVFFRLSSRGKLLTYRAARVCSEATRRSTRHTHLQAAGVAEHLREGGRDVRAEHGNQRLERARLDQRHLRVDGQPLDALAALAQGLLAAVVHQLEQRTERRRRLRLRRALQVHVRRRLPRHMPAAVAHLFETFTQSCSH